MKTKDVKEFILLLMGLLAMIGFFINQNFVFIFLWLYVIINTLWSLTEHIQSEQLKPIPSPQSATDILASKVIKIDNILTDLRTNRIDPATCGPQICELFSKEIQQLEVAKKLINFVFTGNGTGHKELEMIKKEWESVSGEIINR